MRRKGTVEIVIIENGREHGRDFICFSRHKSRATAERFFIEQRLDKKWYRIVKVEYL